MFRMTIYLLMLVAIFFIPQKIWADNPDDGKADSPDAAKAVDQHRPAPLNEIKGEARPPRMHEDRQARDSKKEELKGPDRDGPSGPEARPALGPDRKQAGGPGGPSWASSEGRPVRGPQGFGMAPGRDERGSENLKAVGPTHEAKQAGPERRSEGCQCPQCRCGMNGPQDQGKDSSQRQHFGPMMAQDHRGPGGFGPDEERGQPGDFGPRFGGQGYGREFGQGRGPDFRMGQPMQEVGFAGPRRGEFGGYAGRDEMGPPHRGWMGRENFSPRPEMLAREGGQRGPASADDGDRGHPYNTESRQGPQQSGLLRTIFNRLDVNGDNQLSFAEFSQGVKRLLFGGQTAREPAANQRQEKFAGPQQFNRREFAQGGYGPHGYAQSEFGQRGFGPHEFGQHERGPMGYGQHEFGPRGDGPNEMPRAHMMMWQTVQERQSTGMPGPGPGFGKAVRERAEVAQQSDNEKPKTDKNVKPMKDKSTAEKGPGMRQNDRPHGPPPADKPENTPEK